MDKILKLTKDEVEEKFGKPKEITVFGKINIITKKEEFIETYQYPKLTIRLFNGIVDSFSLSEKVKRK